MLAAIFRSRLLSVALLAALTVSIAVSFGTMPRTQSGPLMLTWIVLWRLGAGVAGSRLRDWLWPALCSAVMLVVVMA